MTIDAPAWLWCVYAVLFAIAYIGGKMLDPQ